VVMDIAMPGMSGHEATRILRRDPTLAGMVILASSATVSDEAIAESKAAGCDDFLPKPVQVEALLAMIGHYLEIEWIRGSNPGGAANEEAVSQGDFAEPPSEDRARLLDLAQKGSVRGLLQEIMNLEARDRRFGPWVTHLRTLVRGFQLKAAQEFLQERKGS